MKRVAWALVVALALLAFPSHGKTPPRSGDTCSKKGISKVYKGVKYTCKKSGKNLTWSKGIREERIEPTPTPTPTPESTRSASPVPSPNSSSAASSSDDYQNLTCLREHEVITTSVGIFRCERRSDTGLILWNRMPKPDASTSQSPSSETAQKKVIEPDPATPPANVNNVKSESIALCKMKEQNATRLGGYNDLATGFPRITPFMKSKGDIKWAVVPIDFADLPGEKEFESRVLEQTDLATEWLSVSSNGQVLLSWYIHKSWVRLPGSYKQFVLDRGQTHNTVQNELIAKLWETAIQESDKEIDYKGVQGVHFILPKGQDFLQEAAKGHAWGWDKVVSRYTTNEGSKIDFFTIPGVFYDDYLGGKRYWSYWVKEYTRGLGAGSIGPRYGDGNYNFMPYDIQANTEGARYLSGWNRFVMDWIPESQIFCGSIDNLKTFEIDLEPLNSNREAVKLALIKITDSTMLVMESRRDDKFSCSASPNSLTRDGVLVYTYNAELSPGEPYFNVISPDGRKGDRYRFCEMLPPANALLSKGDYLMFEGIKIESLFSGRFDRIRITK